MTLFVRGTSFHYFISVFNRGFGSSIVKAFTSHLAVYACDSQFWSWRFSKWCYYIWRNTLLHTFFELQNDCRSTRVTPRMCTQSTNQVYVCVYKISTVNSSIFDKNHQTLPFHFAWDGISQNLNISLSLYRVFLHHRLLCMRRVFFEVKGYRYTIWCISLQTQQFNLVPRSDVLWKVDFTIHYFLWNRLLSAIMTDSRCVEVLCPWLENM
jgi:hypothetical protein